jgi:CheY-like chemotaxis protein
VGKGSEFTLLLPYREKNYTQNWQSQTTATPTDESICAHRSAPRQNNSLILIAEAVPHHIDNLANQLEELGYHPIIARTGTETLYKARQFKPSKILLNSSFSLLSGDDILTLLQSDPRTANIPVWLTAEEKQKQEQKGDLEEICFADRVDGLLSLPIDKQILAQVLSSRKEQSSSENKSLTILRLYPGADAVRQHPQSGIANQPATTKNSSGDFGLNNDGAYKPRGCLRRKPPELESPVRPSRARSAPHLYSLHHRVIEADSLEQGEILARIWQLDVILLDGSLLPEPLQYLHTLREYELLAALPLVTLDAKTTEAANQVDGLSVFPCLVPADQRSLADLVQVIQIAAGIMNQVTSER